MICLTAGIVAGEQRRMLKILKAFRKDYDNDNDNDNES
jgi:hypothetical protein